MQTTLFLAIGLILILVALAVGVYFVMHPRSTLAFLLIFMPFHTLAFQFLVADFGVPASLSVVLQMWREALLGCLAVWILLRALQRARLRVVSVETIVLCALFLLFGFIGLFNSADLVSGVYGYRGTFMPFILFILVLCLPITEQWLRALTPKLIAVGTIIALFAIFQSLVLGFEFVWKYYAHDGVLASSFSFMGGSFQRAMGTFASPNQLSLYLVLIILLALNIFLRSHSLRRKWWLGIALMALSAALILTVSRSGWLAAFIGVGFSFILWKRKRKFVTALAAGLLVAIPLFFVMGLDKHLINTVQGDEISANYRSGLALDNIATAVAHPLGVGFGFVGARANRFSSMQTYNTESYLLQMAMEIGLPGLFLFFLIIGWSFLLVYRNTFLVTSPFLRAWGVTILASVLAALTHAVFIPDLQDITVGMYLWFFVGIGLKLLQIQSSTSTIVKTTKRERLYAETRYLDHRSQLEYQRTTAQVP